MHGQYMASCRGRSFEAALISPFRQASKTSIDGSTFVTRGIIRTATDGCGCNAGRGLGAMRTIGCVRVWDGGQK